MAQITEMLSTLWHDAIELSWLISAVVNAIVIYLMARLILYGYREHSYLYQFEDRERALDNWIKVLLPLVRRAPLRRYRAMLTRDLHRSALRRSWDSSHFIAFQAVYGGAALVISYILFVVLLDQSFMWCVIAAVAAALFPLIKLNDVASRRFVSTRRDLPYFIDYLALAMGAGLDFSQALLTVVVDAPKSPLADEFAVVLRNTKLGMSRAEALLEMEQRMDSPQLKLFVQTMVQAMELGTDVVRTLVTMSETFQQKRFTMAEEMAGKISVRMMLPLMAFLMPAVMIILLGPMLLNSPLFSG